MSSVWDDPELNEDEDEVTPLPELSGPAAALPIEAEQLEVLTAQIVEKVVREIVPELAERLIRAELDRLLKETD